MQEIKNIAVIGLGYVGCVTAACLSTRGDFVVNCYDVDVAKRRLVEEGCPTIDEPGLDDILLDAVQNDKIKVCTSLAEAIKDCKIVMVTVGTPTTKEGMVNLAYVREVTFSIGEIRKEQNMQTECVVCIRSSVPPGTCEAIEECNRVNNTDNYSIVSLPEFLREGTAVDDFLKPSLSIVGCDDLKILNPLTDFFALINMELRVVSRRVAEMIKFVNNSWHALKVAFSNEIGHVCHAKGVNTNELIDLFLSDIVLNVSRAYLKPGFAYGGACLPKDLKCLVSLAQINGSLPVLESIEKSNDLVIERLLQKVLNIMSAQAEREVLFLGITFKPGTDDLRNSPYVSLAKSLVERGVSVSLIDEEVLRSLKQNRNISLIHDTLGPLLPLLREPSSFDSRKVGLVLVSKPRAANSFVNIPDDSIVIDVEEMYK